MKITTEDKSWLRLFQTPMENLFFIMERTSLRGKNVEDYVIERLGSLGFEVTKCTDTINNPGIPDTRIMALGEDGYLEIKSERDSISLSQIKWYYEHPDKTKIIYYIIDTDKEKITLDTLSKNKGARYTQFKEFIRGTFTSEDVKMNTLIKESAKIGFGKGDVIEFIERMRKEGLIALPNGYVENGIKLIKE